MEQFVQDKNGHDLEMPRPTQGAAPQPVLRPFTAVDLAPPAAPGVPGLLGPAISPFLENFSSPFKPPEAQPPIKPPPAPAAEAPRPRSGFQAVEPPVEDDYMPEIDAKIDTIQDDLMAPYSAYDSEPAEEPKASKAVAKGAAARGGKAAKGRR